MNNLLKEIKKLESTPKVIKNIFNQNVLDYRAKDRKFEKICPIIQNSAIINNIISVLVRLLYFCNL